MAKNWGSNEATSIQTEPTLWFYRMLIPILVEETSPRACARHPVQGDSLGDLRSNKLCPMSRRTTTYMEETEYAVPGEGTLSWRAMSWPPWGGGRPCTEMLKMGQLGEGFIQSARHVWNDALKLSTKMLQLTKVVHLLHCPAGYFFKVTRENLKMCCHMFKFLIP